MKTYEFTAEIQQHEGMDAAYIAFPYSVEQEFGTRGQVKVRALFDEVEYRGSLANMGMEFHCLGVTKKVRQQLGKGPGDAVNVRLRQDTEPRTVAIPPELGQQFDAHTEARQRFEQLSYSHQREYAEWIAEAKRAETRERRAARTIEMLMEPQTSQRSQGNG